MGKCGECGLCHISNKSALGSIIKQPNAAQLNLTDITGSSPIHRTQPPSFSPLPSALTDPRTSRPAVFPRFLSPLTASYETPRKKMYRVVRSCRSGLDYIVQRRCGFGNGKFPCLLSCGPGGAGCWSLVVDPSSPAQLGTVLQLSGLCSGCFERTVVRPFHISLSPQASQKLKFSSKMCGAHAGNEPLLYERGYV